MQGFLDVLEFHRKFGLPIGERPRLLPPELAEFRLKFLHEELLEYVLATHREDLVGAIDALADLVYVAYGTAVMMGAPWPKIWAHVQAANMRKIRVASADESKRGSSFDVRKPPGWISPEAAIAKELIAAGWTPPPSQLSFW